MVWRASNTHGAPGVSAGLSFVEAFFGGGYSIRFKRTDLRIIEYTMTVA
jgi:hypothetical protein